MTGDQTCPVCELRAWRDATETDDLVGDGGAAGDGYFHAKAWFLLFRNHGARGHDQAMAAVAAAKQAALEQVR